MKKEYHPKVASSFPKKMSTQYKYETNQLKELVCYLFFFFVLFIISCSPRQQQTPVSDKPLGDELIGRTEKTAALWLATTDYQKSGILSRLDVKSGELRDVLPIGTDVRIFPDGEKGLFLLTSTQNDSLHILEGKDARVIAQRALTSRINPQAVARDGEGRIWLTNQDSNEVHIFTNDLEKEIATIDLSFLKDDVDLYAELSSILFLSPHRIVVSAQRLRRMSGARWVPSEKSGLATIDTQTLKVLSSSLVDVPNPLHLYAVGEEAILLVGSGSLLPSLPLFGRWLNLSAVTLSLSSQTTLSSRILDSSLCADQKLALIEWIPEEEKGCIRVGDQRLLCDQGSGGYIFNKLTCAGALLFVSYIKGGNAELWVIPRDGSEIKHIPMKQQIQGMSVGP